jgi:IS605 OrfB family transposase
MALETVISTRKAAKVIGKHRVSCPHIRGSVRVSKLCAKIEKFEKPGFDYCLRLSGLIKGHPIVLPLKAHRQLLKWLAVPRAVLKDGCVLHENYVAVYIELPNLSVKEIGNDLGLDTGYRKLAVTSDGEVYGTDFSDVCARVRRKCPGSKGKRRSQSYRAQYINQTVKSFLWKSTRTLVLEDLTGLKLHTQQKEKFSKKSRKTMAPWTYRQVLNRIEQLAPEHRVRLVYVDPRNTSRRCPCCGWVAKENRVKEIGRAHV